MYQQFGQEEQECPSDRGHPCEPFEATRSGDVVCSKCGCVLERIHDSHLEKRLFGEAGDEGRKRADVDMTPDKLLGGPELATSVGKVPWKPGSETAPGVRSRVAAAAPSRKIATVSISTLYPPPQFSM